MNAALAYLYPSQCVGCGEFVDSENGLCASCWGETPFVAGAVCDCCGVPLVGGDEMDRDICDDCLKTPRPWSQGRTALIYARRGRRLALSLKHGGREDIAETAGQWMARAAGEITRANTVLVPVPLHWLRLIGRRYNQSALLADAVAKNIGRPVIHDALKRPVATRKLDHLSPGERFGILAKAIVPNPKRDIAGKSVMLIDDVMTSGATLAASTHAALKAGAARVDVLTLARTVRDA
ncbi:MAG: ComF family protein [Pseudomonadota bacterium]